MTESDLGPKPEAVIEPGEPHPGGVDASPDADGVDAAAAEPDPLTRDLDPADNPGVELPAEVKQGEDTGTEATNGDGDTADGSGAEEDPA